MQTRKTFDEHSITPLEIPAPRVRKNNITVGFSTTNSVISKIIRYATKSPCSHAWFCYDDVVVGTRIPIRKIAQAEWFGYETRPRWRWEKENQLVAEFELIGPDPAPAVAFMLQQYLGSKYDYKAAFLTGMWRLLFRSLRSKLNDPVKLMCSEGVIRLLGCAGYSAVCNLEPDMSSPKDVMLRCFHTPSEFKIKYERPTVCRANRF